MNIKTWVGVLSLLMLISFFQGWGQFEPANQINIVLIPSTSLLGNNQGFSYSYNLENKSDSAQSVVRFRLTIPDLTGVRQISPPLSTSQWKGVEFDEFGDLNIPIINWFPENGPSFDPNFFNFPAAEAIKPGQKLSGFKVIASNLPGIRFFWIKGFVRPPSMREIVDYVNRKYGTRYKVIDEVPKKHIDEIPYFQSDHLNAVSGKTVGPDVLANNLGTDQLVSRLIKLNEEALQLGWIDDPLAAKSLGDKLNAARDKLKAGQLETASNILHSFIHDLEPQRYEGEAKDRKPEEKDKHVNTNAFYLLKPNAEFILWKLSQTHKKDAKK